MTESFPDQLDPQQLINDVERLIIEEPAPIARGNMLLAASQAGLTIEPQRLLDTIDEIPNDDERDPSALTPYQQKVSIMQQAVETYASQADFVAAEAVAEHLKPFEDHAYLDGVFAMLKHGYAGTDDKYLSLVDEASRYMPTSNLDPDDPYTTQRLMQYQMYGLEKYACALASYGVNLENVADPHAGPWQALVVMHGVTGEAPWQQQRRQKAVAEAYLEGGHIERAITWKDSINRHDLLAPLCLDIAKATDDPEAKATYFGEVDSAIQAMRDCGGTCGSLACSPQRAKEYELNKLVYLAQDNADAAEYAMNIIGSPSYLFPDHQADIYTAAYSWGGDPQARRYATGSLERAMTGPLKPSMDRLQKIAEADVRYGNVLPSLDAPEEAIPQIFWEIETIFSAVDKYTASITGDVVLRNDFEDAQDPTQHSDTVGLARELLGVDPDASTENAIGPLSRLFGDTATEYDLEECWRMRDGAFASLAPLLISQNAPQAARYFIDKINGQADKVRARIAVAQELARQ